MTEHPGTESAARRIIEAVPRPLLVVRPDHLIVDSNRAYRLARAGQPAQTCCEALDCPTAGEDVGPCLTETFFARAESGPMTVRHARTGIVIRASAPGWAGHEGDVVYVLDAPLREAAPSPEEVETPRLRIFTLGPERVEREDGVDLGDDWLHHRPGQLLRYLVATRGRLISHDEIAEALWPHLGTAGPGTVRHAVHVLRNRLEPDRDTGGTSRYVITRRGSYLLNLATVWVDADAFEAATQSGLDAYVSGETGDAERHMLAALGLYRGEFLADDLYAEWAQEDRERLRALAQVPLRTLTEISIGRGDIEGAADFLYQLARLEPLDTEIQRTLLTLLVRLGRYSRALRLYDAFSARLRRVVGQSPPFDMSDIAADV